MGFPSLTEAIDTTGRLIFHIFGALGQFERDLIQEPTRASRPSPKTSSGAREHMANGLTVREAATRVKVGRTALYDALKTEPA